MSPPVHVYKPHPWLRSALGPFAFRPRLMVAVALGLLAFAVLSLADPVLQWSLRAIISWDFLCLVFVALVLRQMQRQRSDDIRVRVAEQDEGQGLILIVVLIAVIASLVATGVELSMAKDDHGFFKSLRLSLVGLTVALSWFTVHIMFALHYAHEFYAPDRATPEEDDVIGGLQFNGDDAPDYWDFLHFSLVIGVASQTADIAFTSKRMRHIGTVHCIISFLFNTVVLALTINLAASLF